MSRKIITTKDLLEQYESKIGLYRSFALSTQHLLEKLLKRNGFTKYIVTSRGKDRSSLKNKIINNHPFGSIRRISEIDDLAGCRIISYLEADIDRIISLLQSNFKISKQKSKYSKDGYKGIRLVISLSEDRLKLDEYAIFKDLKCEIQLTTILYHAWSELEHDVIYKPEKELIKFDKPAFDSLKARFSQIMEHIVEAQRGLDFIFEEVNKLRQGKKIFDRKYIRTLMQSESINNLYENLKLFAKYVAKYGDKIPRDLNIVETLGATIDKSTELPTERLNSPLGSFSGFNHSDIEEVVLGILDNLKYSRFEDVFNLLVKLSKSNDLQNREKTREIIKKMARYTYWPKEKKIYFYPQLKILTILESWNKKQILENSLTIAEIGRHILSNSYEGYSATSGTMTFHRGSLPVSTNLIQIRLRMLKILFKTFGFVKDAKEKLSLLLALETATEIPNDHGYGDDMKVMILSDAKKVVEFYLKIFSSSDLEILKKIDEQTQWLKRTFADSSPAKLINLENKFAESDSYGLYRLLVGYDHDYNQYLDYEKAERSRSDRMTQLVNDITEENFDHWLKRLITLVKNYKNLDDRGQFFYFHKFLNQLAKTKPEIGLKFIAVKEFDPFIIDILSGIWQSSKRKKGEVKKILRTWVSQGKKLSMIALLLLRVNEIDEPLIMSVFRKAKELRDIDALNNIIRSLAQIITAENKKMLSIILCAIQELTLLKNTWWISYIWSKAEQLFNELDEQEWDIILNNLILLPHINFESEEILSILAWKYPDKFVEYFANRISVKKRRKSGDNYDAIPFNFAPRQTDKLLKLTDQHKRVFIDEIFKWFESKHWLNYWEGAHLLRNLFPEFDPYLESKLIETIRSKKINRVRIVVHVLRAYEGEVFLHGVCKEFIKRYPTNSQYQKEIFIILSQTGVVSGEYGFVDLYKSKLNEIQSWKSDKDESIQKFLKEYESYLRDRIVSEEKRADEEVDHLKREYGEK